MATAEQLRALVKSHFANESERFISIALQIAAHEARQGHLGVAEDLRQIVDKSRSRIVQLKPAFNELQGLVLELEPRKKLNDLIVNDDIRDHITRVLVEYNEQDTLKKFNLQNRRKILLSGPPGTGKTMTASVIAHELHLPLFVIEMHRMITKFMGETAGKLRLVFDMIQERKGVYLFDEFDAIGTDRSKDNDVGEMRRVLNSFLQFLERDESDSLIIAATNSVNILDRALFRRFDDVLRYENPNAEQIEQLLKNNLSTFWGRGTLSDIAKEFHGLSHAEITLACLDAKKVAVLEGVNKISPTVLKTSLHKRMQSRPH